MSEISIEKIDDIIHGRLRMGIMVYLVNAQSATFTELKDQLNVSQGNLSVQMRKLEEAGYVTIDKRFSGRKPLTTIRLTVKGRDAFKAYLETLNDILGLDKQR